MCGRTRAVAPWLGMWLVACGGASPAASTTPAPAPVTTSETVARPASDVRLVLAPITLQSQEPAARTGEARPPMVAQLLDDAGQLTGTRCGATTLSADGVLRRDDVIVAQLRAGAEGLVVADGEGREAGLVVGGDRITSTQGEVRFLLEGMSIVSPDAEDAPVEITPAYAPPETALALFATLLVCNDLGP